MSLFKIVQKSHKRFDFLCDYIPNRAGQRKGYSEKGMILVLFLFKNHKLVIRTKQKSVRCVTDIPHRAGRAGLDTHPAGAAEGSYVII
mgnify:CR=1 FL=1